MRDERLLDYYERELTFLRKLGAEFAEDYKAVASRLRLESTRAEDPHVERLLQGFAFLAARVHLKIDDDFPEISQALLNVVYPHYLRPIPSMSIVEFQLDPDQNMQVSGWRLPRNARLVTPPTSTGARCRFRTCYPTDLWPLRVSSAGWHSPHEITHPSPTQAAAVLRIDLETLGQLQLHEFPISDLRFHLDGEPGLVGDLYELLLNNVSHVVVWDPDDPDGRITLPGDSVRPLGFEPDEGMVPQPRRSFLPYRLLQEYFAFPRKYLFLDLVGLERLRDSTIGPRAQLLFYVTPFQRSERHAHLQEGVDDRTLRLGCTPVVNLFRTDSKPIVLDQRRVEYPISIQGDAEIFSIDRVFALRPGTTERLGFEPFYSLRHRERDVEGGRFWYARREPRGWGRDETSDMWISFVDVDGETLEPEVHSVVAQVLCSNGHLPNQLPFGSETSDFFLEEESAPVKAVSALITPTPSIRPPLGGQQLWRLVSMLSLNYLSLVDRGADAFREMLRVYDFGQSPLAQRHIDGITSVESEAHQAPMYGSHGLSFARGRSVEITFDEEHFTGGSVYLFASVLERFLGLYASINSFSRLVARTEQRPEILKTWPARAGLKPIL